MYEDLRAFRIRVSPWNIGTAIKGPGGKSGRLMGPFPPHPYVALLGSMQMLLLGYMAKSFAIRMQSVCMVSDSSLEGIHQFAETQPKDRMN